jgi:hypothetical protein
VASVMICAMYRCLALLLLLMPACGKGQANDSTHRRWTCQEYCTNHAVCEDSAQSPGQFVNGSRCVEACEMDLQQAETRPSMVESLECGKGAPSCEELAECG